MAEGQTDEVSPVGCDVAYTESLNEQTSSAPCGGTFPKGESFWAPWEAHMSKIIYYNEAYKPLAQKLRREMTRQEKHLWYDFLKCYPVTFRRQKQFGHYIVDFYCAAAKLVVELDGSQHYYPEEKQSDAERDQYLSGLGLCVLHYSNADVDLHFESVCEAIDKAVTERS